MLSLAALPPPRVPASRLRVGGAARRPVRCARGCVATTSPRDRDRRSPRDAGPHVSASARGGSPTVPAISTRPRACAERWVLAINAAARPGISAPSRRRGSPPRSRRCSLALRRHHLATATAALRETPGLTSALYRREHHKIAPDTLHTREDGWLLAAACARPTTPRSRKPAIAIPRADSRRRVRVAAK